MDPTEPCDLVRQDGLRVARGWSGDRTSMASLDRSRIAISGASGLIGQHLVSLLLGLGEVHGLDLSVVALGRDRPRLARSLAAWSDDPRLTLVALDVSRGDPWPSATHLIHAASPATPRLFAADPVGVIRANLLGTLGAVEQAIATGAYLSLISTMEIYGVVPGPVPGSVPPLDVQITEQTLGLVDPLAVRSAYPESKRLAENLVISAAAQHGVRADIVRVSHTYGPGTSPEDDRVQVEFVKQAVSGQKIVLKTDGTLRRHYTYAADTASAIVRILVTAPARTTPEAYNVADNSSRVTIRQLGELALAAAGREPDQLVIDIPPTDPGHQLWSTMPSSTFLDTTKLESLGWEPMFTLESGLARMAEYLRHQL